MNKIQELREKRAKAWEDAKKLLDSSRDENGMLTPETAETYDRMEADIVNLGKEIDRLERAEAMERELGRPLSMPITEKPGTKKPDSKTGRASEEYRQAFWNAIRCKSPRYEIINALQESEDTEGGYLVPETFEGTLIQSLTESNVLRSLCHVIKTSYGDRKIPVVASKGTADWVDEEGPYPPSDDSFNQVSLGAYKLATMIKVSEELLADSYFDLESYISGQFGRRIGDAEELAFLTGNGSSKPTGILHTTGGAEIGVTAASSTAISADELIDLIYSLKAPYRKNAVLLMNDSTVKLIRKLKDGEGQYLWRASITESTPDTILGHRVITSEFMPEAAAGNKAIAYGDFSYYWIADRQGRTFKRLNELYATTGQVGFLASQRLDAKLILPEAIKVLRMKA
jgi:HK97 family phage major capsid protein